MRKREVKVAYQVPQGNELTSVGNKRNVVDLYVGRPVNASSVADNDAILQIDDRIVGMTDLSSAVSECLSRFSEFDRDQVIISIKADASTPMSVINDVKIALRKAGALKVNYSALDIKYVKK